MSNRPFLSYSGNSEQVRERRMIKISETDGESTTVFEPATLQKYLTLAAVNLQTLQNYEIIFSLLHP